MHEWDRHYAGLKRREPYADTMSYGRASEWLRPCSLVADWGCGKGWFKNFVKKDYVGIDGSRSPFADVIADLREYREQTPGILLRHVLEHNYDWRKILDNAIASFTERMVVVLFTPMAKKTTVLKTEPDYGDVPVISFAHIDITDRLGANGVEWYREDVKGGFYGSERLYFLERWK